MEKRHKYNAWKANENGDPIKGTDRIITGKSKRWVINHLAYEEGVEIDPGALIVRCKDGTFWNASKIG